MKRIVTIAAVAITQLALVGAAVAPQLSARLTGETYLVRVEPLDPIDPWRGAYVALAYPDVTDLSREAINAGWEGRVRQDKGPVYLPLYRDGEVWAAERYVTQRPDSGPYLTCQHRGWDITCGIESFFLPQDEAAEMERVVGDGAYAELRVDGRGHAAVVDVRATPRP